MVSVYKHHAIDKGQSVEVHESWHESLLSRWCLCISCYSMQYVKHLHAIILNKMHYCCHHHHHHHYHHYHHHHHHHHHHHYHHYQHHQHHHHHYYYYYVLILMINMNIVVIISNIFIIIIIIIIISAYNYIHHNCQCFIIIIITTVIRFAQSKDALIHLPELAFLCPSFNIPGISHTSTPTTYRHPT